MSTTIGPNIYTPAPPSYTDTNTETKIGQAVRESAKPGVNSPLLDIDGAGTTSGPKTTGNQFVPAPLFNDGECSKPTANIDDMMSQLVNIPNAALSILQMTGLQTLIVKNLSDLAEETLQLMDDFSAVLSELAKSLVADSRDRIAQAEEDALKQTRHSGIIGMIIGLVETIGAIVTLAVTGISGFGGVAAMVMLADGLVRFSAGLMVTINPEKAGGMVSDMLNSGVFAVFDQISDGLGQKVMVAFSVVMGVGALLESGIMLASTVTNLVRNIGTFARGVGEAAKKGIMATITALQPVISITTSIIVIASSVMRLVGMLILLERQFSDEAGKTADKANEDKQKTIDAGQALTFGLVGFLIYELISSTSNGKLLQNVLGDDWGKAAEILIYTITGMIGDMTLNKVTTYTAKAMPLPDDALANSQFVVKLRSAMIHFNVLSGVTQAANQTLNIMIALRKMTFEFMTAESQLVNQAYTTQTKMIQTAKQVEEDIYGFTNDTIIAVARDSDLFGQSVLALMRQSNQTAVNFGASNPR